MVKPMEANMEDRREQMDMCKANILEQKDVNIQDRKDASDRAQVRENREKARVKERDRRTRRRARKRKRQALNTGEYHSRK